ncbi:glycerate kinase isoform X2 [Syngnathus scovelli]|nr:glycerate kinase isoform X2 [Syngnathus scovelli]XP_049589975.1 glycerate kinase isoform X2 [Syngnathus scovelli]XP_049589976.1 glycerate kinase isoform X2 [Syngnathus scovelli]
MARVLSLIRTQPFLALLGRRTMSLDRGAREVFAAAVEGVQPDIVIRQSLERQGNSMVVAGICNGKFPLRNNVHVVGFGKAVLGMATEAEKILGEHLVGGVISVPHGIQQTLRQHGKHHLLLKERSHIQVMEGAQHNLPDADSLKAAECIARLANALTEDDLLLVLISGGGSALLPAPVSPMTLQEKLDITRKLAAAGATIQELNTVRRAFSVLKGGGLAQCAHPAQVVALILSDVIGDPLDLIASGPTVRGPIYRDEVLAVLECYGLLDSAPASVKDVLAGLGSRQGVEIDEAGRVLNVVIGSNSIALQHASRRALELGYRPIVLSPGVCGDVRSVSRLYSLLAHFACSRGENTSKLAAEVMKLGPEVGVEAGDLRRVMQILEHDRTQGQGITCVLAGGEPTVELIGNGRGGRNQELALRVGLELRDLQPLVDSPVFLSGGTDGQDGPTEAAGAVTDAGLYKDAQKQQLDMLSFLKNNDSFTFFTRLSGGRNLVVPGLTCTNVMDVHVLLIPCSAK